MTLDDLYSRTYHPSRYNCAHLVVDAWRILTGDDISEAFMGFAAPQGARTSRSLHARRFRRLTQPESPCIVLMRHGNERPHVGVYTGGDILQIREDGVSCFPPSVATLGYSDVRFYTCLSA